MSLHTPLKRAKGLGSAHHGAHHWWMQRITAIALIPLVLWLVGLLLESTTTEHGLIMLFASPFNTTVMILALGTMLYHGTLGMQVIIEDYVSCKRLQKTMITATQLLSIVTGVSAIVALITFHITHIAGQ